MTKDELKKFVLDVLENNIFVSAIHMRAADEGLMSMIFMPLVFGALKETKAWKRSKVNQIGAFWEYYSRAAPRGVNGYPTFFSFKIIHRQDLKRAWVAVQREQSRRNNIEV